MPKESFVSDNLLKVLSMCFLVFLAAAIIFVVILFLLPKLNSSANDWSVVYLSTGEIYIGKLASFPSLKLTDAYLLQVITTPAEQDGGESQTSFQLTPLKDALWSPKELYLSREQIIFYGPVEDTSRVAETLRKGIGQ